MNEEEVRRKHKIEIREHPDRGWQAKCSCDKYHSSWKEYRGAVVSTGRIHVQREVDKNEKSRGTGS